MAYNIKLTDGTLLVTIPNNSVIPAGSLLDLTLYGKGRQNYGESWNENFVHLLENFSDSSAPTLPLEGQLWYDKGTGILKLYVGGSPGWSEIVTAGAGSGLFVNITGDTMTGDLNMSGNDLLSVGTLSVGTITVSGTVDGVDISAHVADTNIHEDHTAISVIAGNGLTGGGTIDANRTLHVGAGTGISVAANTVDVNIPGLSVDASPAGTDYLMTYDGSTHRKVTLSNVAAAVSPLTKSTSGAQTINNVTTWAHGLGVEPDIVSIWIQCVNPEYGYVAGERILISNGVLARQTVADANEYFGITVQTTSSQVVINSTTRLAIQSKGSGGDTFNYITRANWRYYIKAVAL